MKACFEYMTVEMKLITISFAIDFIIKKSLPNLMALKGHICKFGGNPAWYRLWKLEAHKDMLQIKNGWRSEW